VDYFPSPEVHPLPNSAVTRSPLDAILHGAPELPQEGLTGILEVRNPSNLIENICKN
jgi:hypothetical protein